MVEWNYGGAYLRYNMSGEVELPNASKVMVCDWTLTMPEFMKDADTSESAETSDTLANTAPENAAN